MEENDWHGFQGIGKCIYPPSQRKHAGARLYLVGTLHTVDCTQSMHSYCSLTSPHPSMVVFAHTSCCQSRHTLPEAQVAVPMSNLEDKEKEGAQKHHSTTLP